MTCSLDCFRMDTKPEHNRNSEPIEENRENKAPKIHVLVLDFIHTHTHKSTRSRRPGCGHVELSFIKV